MKRRTKKQTVVDAAVQARQDAYAPYSGFRVGAAVQLEDGRIFTGVNVESCSYGLTVCAERHAVAAAVAAGARPGAIVSVVVAADADAPTPPCGACRQVLAEHLAHEARLLLHNLRDGTTREYSAKELLPVPFLPSSIPGV